MADNKNTSAEALNRQVAMAIQRIAASEDAKSLRNLHENIQRHPDLDDIRKEELTEALMQRLRVVSPALATRLGGPKASLGREYLQSVFNRVSDRFDLSGNQVGQGVKTGGFMINGTRHVDVYLSYKTSDRRNLGFAWIQETVESEPFLELKLRDLSDSGAAETPRETFTDQELAATRFEEELDRLLGQ
ncbi:hypothetical protein [Pseudosulfitobacter koreensis]|uniref:Uncharacterized protein n=1 Tax=Pseudosulfitobacter koreensis TaxID=2968472 RepID=A0ABT1YWI1_9RHOB|nr:hypothetical protein [Pseudosulfitobacter koreense]MCR8825253.1 hypothetical protein [Pseudosulfitobacter koreense]